MHPVVKLTAIHPDVVQAIRDVARDLAGDIRRFNAMQTGETGYVDLGARIRGRFGDWHRAWWTVHRVTGLDGRPPLEELLALARVRSDKGFMQEVILNAEAHLASPSSSRRMSEPG